MLKFYVKPINACNLACKHCFVDHTKPRLDNYFERVADFINQAPANTVTALMHGGEPMLLPPEEIKNFYEMIKPEHDLLRSLQTNLAYTLTEKKLDLFKDTFRSNIGTSWDITDRFVNDKILNLWKDNVRTCVQEGIEVSICVVLTKKTMEVTTPKELIEMCIDLGAQYIIIERVTGAPTINNKDNDIFPSPRQLDTYLHDMFNIYRNEGYHLDIEIPFFSTVIMNMETSKDKGGNFCRACETFTYTINSDGGVAGCPNDADFVSWGHIDEGYNAILKSRWRQKSITCEKIRPEPCYTCEFYNVCGGDCYKLEHFDEDCYAPKKVYAQIRKEGERFYWDMLHRYRNEE